MEKYPVSKTKIYEELKRRGLTAAKVSQELGFTSGYIAHAANNGVIPARGAMYLERMFNITPEDYRPDLLDMMDKAKPETPEDIPAEFIQKAAETFAKTFRETIKNAVIEALKERDA